MPGIFAQLDDAKYAAVLRQYKPRPIHTEEDNQRAIGILECLRADDALTPEKEALAEMLATLIEKFEEEQYALNHAAPSGQRRATKLGGRRLPVGRLRCG